MTERPLRVLSPGRPRPPAPLLLALLISLALWALIVLVALALWFGAEAAR